MSQLLWSPYSLGSLTLQNRIVMAPMTRSRAPGGVPNEQMAKYYALRADAGLIITEGTSPSANGMGYPRIPGCYNEAQAKGWRQVTDAVHAKGGKIFIQFMHTGRVSHPLNLPAGARVLAPSALTCPGQMWTDQKQMQNFPTPEAMSVADIQTAVQEFAQAAKLAVEKGGFDGVELHGANGYLIEQFLNPATNQRTDQYGGNAENRQRFTLEVAQATVKAIGAGKTGIRVSPYGVFNGMGPFEGIDEQYTTLASRLGELGLAYIHLVDHSAMGAPPVPASIKEKIQKAFKRTLILVGGYDAAKAEADLQAKHADLIAVGRPFVSNPSLVKKLKTGAALTPYDQATFYTPGEPGYLSYPEN